MTDNLKLWDAVEGTDPDYTKKIEGKNFNGTSINPMYLTKKATEHLGPMGKGWGVESICHYTQQIGDTMLFSEQVRLWYIMDGERCEVSQWASVKLSYVSAKQKHIVDDEAHKKCRTAATSKCLSLLGFSADIWLQYYNSPQYVTQMKKEHERKDVAAENMKLFRELTQNLEKNCACAVDSEKEVVCQWVMDDPTIELSDLKIDQATTVQIKEKLAEKLADGLPPKKFLKLALEWFNDNKN